MNAHATRPIRALAVAALLAVALAGCGDDGQPDTAGDASATTTTTTATAGATELAVEVRDGQVVGGLRRFDVDRGDEVVLRVTADVADEVHVHGYDLTAPVGPGQPAELRFTADVPGVFEVELEGRHLRVAQLAVR